MIYPYFHLGAEAEAAMHEWLEEEKKSEEEADRVDLGTGYHPSPDVMQDELG